MTTSSSSNQQSCQRGTRDAYSTSANSSIALLFHSL
jgi:hypothetical protein